MAGFGRAALDLDQSRATGTASATPSFSAALVREGGSHGHQHAAGKEAHVAATGRIVWSRRGAAQAARNTSDALVPPKPKLFDMTVRSGASRVSRRIGQPAARGSSASMFADAAMKPPSSISRL